MSIHYYGLALGYTVASVIGADCSRCTVATVMVRRVRGRTMTAAIWAAVMLIGGVGSVLRFVVDRSVAGRVARSFPLGTLVVTSPVQCYSAC